MQDISSDELPPVKKQKILLVKSRPDSWGVTHVTTHKCTYLWEIYNFNVCSKKTGESLESPLFNFKDNDNYKWCLRLYPKGVSQKSEGQIVLILDLKSKPQESLEEIEVEYEFSLVSASGEEKYSFKSVNWFNTKLGKGQHIIARRVLYENATELLPNNTLTLLCKVNAGTGGCLGISRVPADTADSKSNITITLPQKWQTDTLRLVYNENKYTDITFIVDGHKFYAHKAIVAARSPAFAEILEKASCYGVPSIVEVTDVRRDIFAEILRFIYTAKISDPKTITYNLLAAAEQFGLPELKRRCEIMLSNSLKIDNVVTSLVFAEQHEAAHLKSRSIDFILANIKDVIETPAYKEAIISNPQLIIEVFHRLALKEKF